MKRLLPGAIVRQVSDPDRLYLVTATSSWGFEVKANNWVPWDKATGWEAFQQLFIIGPNEWVAL